MQFSLAFYRDCVPPEYGHKLTETYSGKNKTN
jgi:hypothetical protein